MILFKGFFVAIGTGLICHLKRKIDKNVNAELKLTNNIFQYLF